MDRKAVRTARITSSKLQSTALRGFANNDFTSYRDSFLARIIPITRDLMVAAYLQGRLTARKDNLSLANPFVTILKGLRTKLGISSFIYETILVGFEKVAENRVSELYDSLEKSLQQLDTLKEVREKFNKLGITVSSDFQLATLYRTSSSAAFNGGLWDVYNQDSDLWGFTYSAIDDDVVRESHWAQNGVTMPKADGYWRIWWPPNGYNCRCIPIPVYNSQNWVLPPIGYAPDEGFEFNSGVINDPLGFNV